MQTISKNHQKSSFNLLLLDGSIIISHSAQERSNMQYCCQTTSNLLEHFLRRLHQIEHIQESQESSKFSKILTCLVHR